MRVEGRRRALHILQTIHYAILDIKYEYSILPLFAVCVRVLQDLSTGLADVSVKGVLGNGFVLLSIC